MRNELAQSPAVVETGAIAALVHDSQMVHVDRDGCLAIELRPHPVAERFLDAFRDRNASLGSW